MNSTNQNFVVEKSKNKGVPNVEDDGRRRGVGEGGEDGTVEGVVAAGVVEHVEVGGGREEGLVLPALVLGLLFFLWVEWVVDEEPFGMAGYGVVAELEDAGGVGHGRGCGDVGRGEACVCGCR